LLDCEIAVVSIALSALAIQTGMRAFLVIRWERFSLSRQRPMALADDARVTDAFPGSRARVETSAPAEKARLQERAEVHAVRPPAGGFVAAVGGWSLGRAGAAAFAAAGALGDVISTTVLSSSALAQARSPPVRAGALLALRIDIRQRLADPLLPSSTA